MATGLEDRAVFADQVRILVWSYTLSAIFKIVGKLEMQQLVTINGLDMERRALMIDGCLMYAQSTFCDP